ncbi:MAG: hypothetical protein WB239_03660 [Acidimicrobiia bacterium]
MIEQPDFWGPLDETPVSRRTCQCGRKLKWCEESIEKFGGEVERSYQVADCRCGRSWVYDGQMHVEES